MSREGGDFGPRRNYKHKGRGIIRRQKGRSSFEKINDMIRSQKSRVTLLVANVVLLGIRAQKALFTPANC
jgi:hypothetical protein